MSLVIAALLAVVPGTLSSRVTQEERLRFVFVNKGHISRYKIAGSAREAIPWSRQSMVDVVVGCGGERVASQFNGTYTMVIDAGSGANNLRVAQCVKAAVAVRFSVGVRTERGRYDETAFMSLWEDKRTS